MKAAVAVGCSAYTDHRISNLDYAHQDAVRFVDRLLAVTGMRADHAITLWDGADDPFLVPTRGNVLTTLAGLQDWLPEPPEALFFFFSGHGIHSPDGSDYLLTRDALTNGCGSSGGTSGRPATWGFVPSVII